MSLTSSEVTMKIHIIWWLALILFMVAGCVEKPTNTSNRGIVSGTVLNETIKSPLSGVTISIENVGSKTTDVNGYYFFNDIVAGTYTITASKSGYATEQANVNIEPNLNKTVDFTMHLSQPAQLLLSLSSVNFGLEETQAQILINNGGDDQLTWQVTSNQTWLTVQPLSGSTLSETDVVTVTANRTGLENGQYSASLSFSSNGGSNVIPVSIEVAQYVAAPVINPPGGTFTSPQTATISCSTSGAQIRYTLDGSEPTSSSNIYSGALTISTSTVIKAKAYKSGWSPSPTTTSNFIISQVVANPIFAPQSGTYNSAQSVTISCTTNGAEIRYTTNGNDPTESSTLYSSPINVSTTTTIKAKAYKSGWTPSSITSAVYTISTELIVETPSFNPPGGTYTTPQTVTISCSTSGATIRYTTNGTDPTTSSTIYSSPITISNNTNLKAKAFKSGWTDSNVAYAIYTINQALVVADPIIDPPGGNFSSMVTVDLSCPTSGAMIYYTYDGSEPTTNSQTVYYGGYLVISMSVTLRVKAFKSGYTPSNTVTAVFTF